MQNDLFCIRGGRGPRLLLLLHGIGANSSVWKPMLSLVEQSWNGTWIAPDFRGHGRSPYLGPYGCASHAADIAELIDRERATQVVIVGHSFGGVVGAVVATGWFGPPVSKLYSIGVKLRWTMGEIDKAHALGAKPARIFATTQRGCSPGHN